MLEDHALDEFLDDALLVGVDEHSPVFSPDGGWIAYVSDESGRQEVYVVRADGHGGKHQVSLNGGVSPLWNPAGGELFFVEGPSMMAVPVTTGSSIVIGRPQKLFDPPTGVGRLYWVTHHDVSRDGQRFLTIALDPAPAVHEIRVVQDWFRDVEAALDAAED